MVELDWRTLTPLATFARSHLRPVIASLHLGVIASESEAIQALLPQHKETEVKHLIFHSSY